MKPRTTVFVTVEGESEKVYLDRLNHVFPHVSIVSEISSRKKAAFIVKDCISKSRHRGLLPEDIRAVIFDMDTISESDLLEAESLAEKENVGVYVSKECFEIWLVMHFTEPCHLYSKDDYNDELSRNLNKKYRKSDGIGENVTLEKVKDAAARSRKSLPSGRCHDCFSKMNSSNLYLFIESLLSMEKELSSQRFEFNVSSNQF